MMPEHFFVPWSDIDPELKHGGIPGELAAGWVGPDLGDNTQTVNRDMVNLVWELSQSAASISMHPESDAEGFPGKSLVSEALRATDTVTERVVDMTHTHASKFFSFTHAIPPRNNFKVSAIRYPVRNTFADEFIHYAIGTIVEFAENNRNALHRGLDPNAANTVLMPLYSWKAGVMKFWFDLEVAGEISSRELEELYAGKLRPQPSYPDADAPRPTVSEVQEALTGMDVLAWVPNEADWSKFAELHTRRYTPERVLQPEGSRSTTEDVRDDQPTVAGQSTGGPSA